MEIFVYSDESGVFDCYHSQYFVFGGLVFLDSQTMESEARRYLSVENIIRNEAQFAVQDELKASVLDHKNQLRLFRTSNREFRFGVVVEIPKLRIRWQIADDKKSRQRYMDFAFKIAVKRFFASLIQDGAINPKAVEVVHFFTDQHTTATNGKYELREGLEQELIHGTFNFEHQTFRPPLFPNARSITLKIYESNCSFALCKLERPGHNALDFYITSHIGEVLGRGYNGVVAIVSHDKGFRAIYDYWKTRNPGMKIVCKPDIGSCIVSANENSIRRKLLNKEKEMVDFEKEFQRFEKRNQLEKQLKETLPEWDLKWNIQELAEELMHKQTGRDTYLGLMRAYGIIDGQTIYKVLKKVG